MTHGFSDAPSQLQTVHGLPLQIWLTRRQAAAYAQVSEATIGREVRAGRLRCVRVGGRTAMRFKREWLDRWLEWQPADSA